MHHEASPLSQVAGCGFVFADDTVGMKHAFNKTEEHQRFFDEAPEFIVTRRTGPRNHEPVQYIDPYSPMSVPLVAKPAEEVIEYTRTTAQQIITERGGIVEIWQRVGCFKAEAKDWS